MKIYGFGESGKPVIVLLPGMCAHWESNFGRVIDYLTPNFHVACVSYSGFDETVSDQFVSVTNEVETLEAWIKDNCGGSVYAMYGSGMGAVIVSLMLARNLVSVRYAIMGSPDLDQCGKVRAKLQAGPASLMFHNLLQTGTLPAELQQKFEDGKVALGDYGVEFYHMLGIGVRDMTFVTQESVRNQFSTSLTCGLPKHIGPAGTEIHVIYARKMDSLMGKGIFKLRYEEYYQNAVIHELDMRHEELLAVYPEKWAELITAICGFDPETVTTEQ